jgi:hypothetical protein
MIERWIDGVFKNINPETIIFSRVTSSGPYDQLAFLECSSERICSSARDSVALVVSAQMEATMYPKIAPNAGVSGHACDIRVNNLRYHSMNTQTCQGRSQSKAIGITPSQPPTTVPIAG